MVSLSFAFLILDKIVIFTFHAMYACWIELRFFLCFSKDTWGSRSGRALECCMDKDYCNRNLRPTIPPLVTSGSLSWKVYHSKVSLALKQTHLGEGWVGDAHCHLKLLLTTVCCRRGNGSCCSVEVMGWGGRDCRLGLFSHSIMKRTASPQGLLEFLASGRIWGTCPSVTPRQSKTHTHAQTHKFVLFLSLLKILPILLLQIHQIHFLRNANIINPNLLCIIVQL